MKKTKKIFIIILLLSISTLVISNFDKIIYYTETSNFKKITVDELPSTQNQDENFIVYIGRSTCPYCRAFVPKLNRVSKEHDVKIYYIDSEDGAEGAEDLIVFRDKNKIATVPALLNIQNDVMDSVMDSTLSETEILEFIL